MTPIVAQTNPPSPDLLTVSQEVRSQEYRDFLKYLAQSSGIASYEQMSILFPAICQGAMEWLLKEKKSVDFGFVMLHPMPHRANWKQILLALFPTLGVSLLGKSRQVKEDSFRSSGFWAKLFSGELLAVAQERYVVWGVETELKRSWWRAMYRYERWKHSSLGSVGYATHTARQIERLKSRITNVYISFLRQVAYPCGKVQHSRVYRRGFIVPFVPRGKVRPVADPDIPVDYIVPRSEKELVPPTLADLISTDAGVPEVSDIRPDNQDLRVTSRVTVAGGE